MNKPFGGGGIKRGMDVFDNAKENKIESYSYPDEDKTFERTLQEEEAQLKSHPSIKIDRHMVRAFRAFRNSVPSIKHANPENLDIYLIATENPHLDLEITRAMSSGNAIPNFKVLTDTRQEAQLLQKHGGIQDAFKGDPARRMLSEPVDIVVVMDEQTNLTWRTLRNVQRGGWLLLPVNRANVARASGMRFMGVIETDKGYPSVRQERDGADYWKEKEIETDEQLKNAVKEEGVVTFEEAKQAVLDAFNTTDNIVENYKRLIEMAKEQNSSPIAEDGAEINYRIERGNQTKDIQVKLLLPLTEIEHNTKDLAIFKKKEAI